MKMTNIVINVNYNLMTNIVINVNKNRNCNDCEKTFAR